MSKRKNIESKTENLLIYGGSFCGVGLFAAGGFIWAAIKKANDIADGKTKFIKVDNIYFYVFLSLMILLITSGVVLLILGMISKRKNSK